MAMTVTPSRGNPCSVGVGSWTLGIVIAAVLVSPAAAQVPNAAAAIDAARDAKAKTEAAQKKNAEALDPPQAAAGPASPQGAGPQGAGAQGAQSQTETPPAGPGYSYDPAGRGDPCAALLRRARD